MSLFFVGINPRWQLYRFLPDGLHVMYSAGGFWNGNAWRRKKFQARMGLRWLDCGGFNLLNKYRDFPFTVTNYANLVAYLRPDYYATMDYPCEPDISRSLSLMSNAERIRATVDNALSLMEWQGQLPGTLVPVIQGYTLREYQDCIDLYRQNGGIRDYMAVGSMCRRLNSQQLNTLIPGIYRAARLNGARRLHFFGLKISPDLKGLDRYIYSRDSAVALDDYGGMRNKRQGRRWPRGQKEKEQAFNAFLDRLNSFNLIYN